MAKQKKISLYMSGVVEWSIRALISRMPLWRRLQIPTVAGMLIVYALSRLWRQQPPSLQKYLVVKLLEPGTRWSEEDDPLAVMAESVALDANAVKAIFTGRKPNQEELTALASLLEVDVDELLDLVEAQYDADTLLDMVGGQVEQLGEDVEADEEEPNGHDLETS